jgi:hypothetical protein
MALKRCLLMACCCLLGSQAWAGAKKVSGLDFELSPPPKEQCLSQPISVRHDRETFFKNLKVVKRKSVTQFRRGQDVVVNYPESTTIKVDLWRGPEMGSCIVLPRFDPAKVQFRVEWQRRSQAAPAEGTFAVTEQSAPPAWCENTCIDYWEYELTIDSQDVPLDSELVLTIETKDGTRLAKYIGKLSYVSSPRHKVA